MLLSAALTCSALGLSILPAVPADAASPRQMEALDRGLVAVKSGTGVFVSWRLLGTEVSGTAFNLYRGDTLVNSAPLTNSTNYQDTAGTSSSTYTVRAVIDGKEQPSSAAAQVWADNYLNVPLSKPAGGTSPDGTAYTYTANDASTGDLDGDGQYELIVKWDPSNSKDNSQAGYTGETYLDAYKLNGTRLWRINLGPNVRAGAHYSPFIVYDLNGDGVSELAVRTADGTVDGAGQVIGDDSKDYRTSNGYVLSGPEYLTIFEGASGREMDTIDFEPARGKVADWGDNYGNRVDRFLAAVAYLDGTTPSLIMTRGYYAKTMLVAYDLNGTQLSKRWTFDSTASGNAGYAGQGNHNLSIADVDHDGRDEILYGSMTVDDNGKGLYTTGLGHGDAMHAGDLNPKRSGLEVFQVHEDKGSAYGLEVHDARTGDVLWGIKTGTDVGRGLAADIDPRTAGAEVWANGGLYSITGQQLGTKLPSSTNFAIWWDGDPLRELLDANRIDKWDYTGSTTKNLLTASGAASNNGTKSTPALQADLLGDWREEVVWRTADSSALRIYTTTAVTDSKIYTLMHDPVYRLGVAWQNAGYNQPPHTGFFIGDGMSPPPAPNITLVR
ncbi:rhamnogalacturonan lyase [Paenibacillus sp. Z6-24]